MFIVTLTILQRNPKWTISQAASLICLAAGMMINEMRMLPIMEASALSNHTNRMSNKVETK